MSELKERMLGQSMNEYGCDTKIYLKSEADKVIADLKQKIKQQDVLLGKALNAISESHKHVVSLARKCNHANYKRCLAMAKSCEYRFMNLEKMINTDYRTKKMRLSQRWWAIWLKIADKFKDDKEALELVKKANALCKDEK